ncbi:MAG: UDP-N-acetylmuramoyl-L-alanine--D-glutamate ligase [Candidatus Latescibacterota bacterium]
MSILNKKAFFVFGAARSGRAAAILLAGKKYSVSLYDDDSSAVEVFMKSQEIAGLESRLTSVERAQAEAVLLQSDCLVLSPGVALDHPLVVAARKNGVHIISELELAYQFCSEKLIAVTGTNGKSTVVNIIGQILQEAGERTVVAGNVGKPFSSVISTGHLYDRIVLEVSSFQLDTIVEFKADIAVLLNVTPDHLDRYGDSFDEYALSKARILNGADENSTFVYNAEDEVCRRIAQNFQGRKIEFSSARRLDEGVYLQADSIVSRFGGREDILMNRNEFTPIGVHNAENAMAAVAAVAPLDINKEVIVDALKKYHPLPHRMELVRVIGGVAYVNDSKATNVDAAVKSIVSIKGNLILIIGGRDKNGDFSVLLPNLDHVSNVIVIGEAARKIEKILREKCSVTNASDMDQAVLLASKTARAGDTVLLAPACASFDMFKDYAHRGEAFKSSVKAL